MRFFVRILWMDWWLGMDEREIKSGGGVGGIDAVGIKIKVHFFTKAHLYHNQNSSI